jgi:hypothetical protein
VRKLSAAVVGFFVLFALVSHSNVSAREPVKPKPHVWRYWLPEQYAGHLSDLDPGLRDLYSSAAVDTYNIIWYNFEPNNWQGWTQVDNTAQPGTFFHADDFAGLDGGYYGRLAPIGGTKSVWCGARPGTDEYMCGWYYAPGYGNNWDQSLGTLGIQVDGGVAHFTYHGVFDSDSDYDFTYVEYMKGYEEWTELDKWSGVVDTTVSYDIYLATVRTKLRFRFVSDPKCSDQDGYINTDGACIIDDISISDDSGVIDIEDFEEWEVGEGAHAGAIWMAQAAAPYGIYSDLWSNLTDRDPCNDNFGTQVAFFDPGMWWPQFASDTPFCQGPGRIEAPCQDEMVVSPVIDLTKYSTGNNEVQDADIPGEDLSELGGILLRYTLYGDLPFENLVFATCYVRDVDPVTGCPGQWEQVYYPAYGYFPEPSYYFMLHDIGRFVGSDQIQVALGVWDACAELFEAPPNCLYHTASPWYDNVRVQRYKGVGPQWSWQAYDLFQDNFPEEDFDIESFVRADAADDKALPTDPFFAPGDSIVVTCVSTFGGGIRLGGVSGGGEVYMHVRCIDISGWLGKSNLYGPSLEGDYGAYVSDDGAEWTVIQCDTARTQYVNPIPDAWCVDLNDMLLTRGYMVEYYFSAVDVAGDVTTLPKGGAGGAAGSGLTSGPDKMFEFTCLPTGRGDILYVDDFDGRGCHEGIAQIYYDKTFVNIMFGDMWPDRYDVNAPSSMVGNGLASRATVNHLIHNDVLQSGYRIIIWDSGDLDVGTIGDGNPAYEKTDDCLLLCNWLNQSDSDVGLWISGDDIAYDLSQNLGSVPAIMLMSTWCGVNHVGKSYFDLTGGFFAGGVVNPLITGADTGIFWNSGDPYQFYLYGGCPLLSDFDVLEPTNFGVEALLYPDHEGVSYAAAIQSYQVNAAEHTARTMWLGSSFMNIRDTEIQSPLIRFRLLYETLVWFYGMPFPYPMGGETPGAYSLAQNYPNPFNPTTTIHFDIREKGQVSLRIYNVAGQLVRTLVDGELEAASYTKDWNGLNNAGVKVASGVYFYRLEASEFQSVKKMVLLR